MLVALVGADGALLAHREVALADHLERRRRSERVRVEVDRTRRGVGQRLDRVGVGRVDDGGGNGKPIAVLVDRADAVHERRRERLGVGRDELVVDAQPTGVAAEHPAAHEQRRAQQLLAMMAGVGVVHEVRAVGPTVELSQHRVGRGVRVDAVVAHVHVPEVVDLVLGHRAGVRDGEHRSNLPGARRTRPAGC